MAGNILLKGYTAAIATCLTTELNSLADTASCALSSEITNASNLDLYVDFQLHLASVTISSTSAYGSIFIVSTPDGTTYPNWDAATPMPNYGAQYFVGNILIKNVSAAVFEGSTSPAQSILLPPGKFKVALKNSCGVAFASSGNTLSIRTYANSYT
jgi:hypothetical protein